VTLADPDFDARPLRHAAVSCHLQRSYVHECVGSACQSDRSKALVGIEPFDDCFNGFSMMLAAGSASGSGNLPGLRLLRRRTYYRHRNRGALALGSLCSGPFEARLKSQ
jgi:hypothetical protein